MMDEMVIIVRVIKGDDIIMSKNVLQVNILINTHPI